ncbi:MAG: DNA integrity scanning diadenylate cyclase DisA [Clostridia bacterium]|nr:DNA integrity scanning diadenylate cyclase DisA [Clostridia bacterium]MDD4376240.1 DNA integrity scanning diadenylate cyclase DisA [Clostridia bacterium]
MLDESTLEIIKKIAPGTAIREGLENILRAKTGALIVIAETESISKIIDGGFEINQEYNPAKIYELAKMDGAIILNKDFKRILKANVELVPDYKIKTSETGTRHRSAERVAKQTDSLVICISQRRGVITLFKGDIRYVMDETDTVITRANQALEALEKYKTVLEYTISNLDEQEIDDMVTLDVVTNAIYRSEIVIRMEEEVKRNIIELGVEGNLIEIQLKQLMHGVELEEKKIIEDYMIYKNKNKEEKVENVLSTLKKLSLDELLSGEKVAKALGYKTTPNILDEIVSAKGYRILGKIPKMPISIIDNLIDAFYSLQGVCSATVTELDEVEGIGETRAKFINQTLRKLQEQYLIKSYKI